MPNDVLPSDTVEQAGGMAEIHKMRAAAIETVFRYLDSLQEDS
jgi:hypothetical protein